MSDSIVSKFLQLSGHSAATELRVSYCGRLLTGERCSDRQSSACRNHRFTIDTHLLLVATLNLISKDYLRALEIRQLVMFGVEGGEDLDIELVAAARQVDGSVRLVGIYRDAGYNKLAPAIRASEPSSVHLRGT
ncbi:hypothetical protein [Rhizobium mongolense]|uniref:hypothetical protein n=1 Tax=Rhizobium mongolense TaxID=57676 RepID=UPI0034A23827